jgi:transcriptional regulator with XRE-family HTH domain
LKPRYVADKCGIKLPYYYSIERGERTPSLPVIMLLAQTLRTSVDYLTCKSDNPAPSDGQVA